MAFIAPLVGPVLHLGSRLPNLLTVKAISILQTTANQISDPNVLSYHSASIAETGVGSDSISFVLGIGHGI